MVRSRIVVKASRTANRASLASRLASMGARQRFEMATVGRPTITQMLDGMEMMLVDVDPARHVDTLNALAVRTDVRFAAPVYKYEPSFVPNDTRYADQYHHPLMGHPAAWDVTPGGSAAITIAILDTGTDGAHPDLAPNMVSGFNFHDNNTDTRDVHGHGTAVAGCAAAAGHNALGVSGVAYRSRIMPCRISDANGSAYSDTIAAAMRWAADRGAKVVNCSFGPLQGDTVIESAATYVRNRGGLVFVSAGNDGTREPSPEHAHINYISATDSADNLTSWSTYGPNVKLSAPGNRVLTTTRGGSYSYWSGTSFASPVAAGAAALVWAAKPSMTSYEVEAALYGSAVDRGNAGRDERYGYGRIATAAAITRALGTTVTSPPPAPAPPANTTAKLLVRHKTTGALYAWHLNGTSVTSAVQIATQHPLIELATAADMNKDGQPDLIWIDRTNGNVLVWLMNGNTMVSALKIATIPSYWSIQHAGDFNGDGEMDLVLLNRDTYTMYFWFMQGTTVTGSHYLGTIARGWAIKAAGDFDKDGQSDIVLHNTETGTFYFWMMDGVYLKPGGDIYLGRLSVPWSPGGSVDFNADGNADLVLHNPDTGALYAWQLDGYRLMSGGDRQIAIVDTSYTVLDFK